MNNRIHDTEMLKQTWRRAQWSCKVKLDALNPHEPHQFEGPIRGTSFPLATGLRHEGSETGSNTPAVSRVLRWSVRPKSGLLQRTGKTAVLRRRLQRINEKSPTPARWSGSIWTAAVPHLLRRP